jgi:hypothetical protein
MFFGNGNIKSLNSSLDYIMSIFHLLLVLEISFQRVKFLAFPLTSFRIIDNTAEIQTWYLLNANPHHYRYNNRLTVAPIVRMEMNKSNPILRHLFVPIASRQLF